MGSESSGLRFFAGSMCSIVVDGAKQKAKATWYERNELRPSDSD